MIKIKEKELIMETIGVSVPLIDGFFIESVEADDEFEKIIFISDQGECFIICTSGTKTTLSGQNSEISINDMTGSCDKCDDGRHQTFNIQFDAVNNCSEVLRLSVMVDAEDATDWDSMEENTDKVCEKLNKVLESEKVKEFINGIKSAADF